MNRVSDLNMIKGRDVAYQRTVIDELTNRFSQSVTGINVILVEMPKDDLVDLSVEEPEQVIRYALLAIIAADIATVPYPDGRAFHMDTLKDLAATYNLSPRKIVYLTRYADEWMNRLEALERHLGII
jgi:hypothetical protein